MKTPAFEALNKNLTLLAYFLKILWLILLSSILLITLYAIGEGLFVYIQGPTYFPSRLMLRTWLQHLPYNPWQALAAQTVHQLQLPLALAIFALAALILWIFINHTRKISQLNQQILKLKRTQESLETATLDRLLRKWTYDQRLALDNALQRDHQAYQQRIYDLQQQQQQLISQLHNQATQNNEAVMSWQESQQRALRRLLQDWLVAVQSQEDAEPEEKAIAIDTTSYQLSQNSTQNAPDKE